MPERKRIVSTTGGAQARDPQARDARAGDARAGDAQARYPQVRDRRQEMRVLVIAQDRRFREVASLLLTRRGCSVSVSASASMLAERVTRAHTEVVVIDAT